MEGRTQHTQCCVAQKTESLLYCTDRQAAPVSTWSSLAAIQHTAACFGQHIFSFCLSSRDVLLDASYIERGAQGSHDSKKKSHIPEVLLVGRPLRGAAAEGVCWHRCYPSHSRLKQKFSCCAQSSRPNLQRRCENSWKHTAKHAGWHCKPCSLVTSFRYAAGCKSVLCDKHCVCQARARLAAACLCQVQSCWLN